MATMRSEALRSYIANLPVGAPIPPMAEGTSAVNSIDINNLPNGIVVLSPRRMLDRTLYRPPTRNRLQFI
jgi:hypothetical protein